MYPSSIIVDHLLHAFRSTSEGEHVGYWKVVEDCIDNFYSRQLSLVSLLNQRNAPAGRMAFDSSIICVLRSDARMDGCAWAWGTARLKLDLVAILLAMCSLAQSTYVVAKIVVMFALPC